jgi:hypothetical protein
VEPASSAPAPLDPAATDHGPGIDAGQAADADAGQRSGADGGRGSQAERAAASDAGQNSGADAGRASQAERAAAAETGQRSGAGPRPVDVADGQAADGVERTTAGEQAGDNAQVAAASRAGRGQERRPRDMIMSLAVLLVPIALLLILYRTLLNGDAPITVDPVPTIQEAQAAKLFTVAVPQGLGDDWHTSSATFTRAPNGATLRLGYVDPDKDPVQLIESSVPTDALLPAELSTGAKPTGNFRSASGVWRVYDARPGEKALVLGDQNRTIVIVGRTDVDNLEKLATSLN